ncbi:MAG: MarR family transcriptional regulator [Pseudomonadota bacterium]
MPDIEIAHLVDRFMRRIHAALNEKAPEFDTHSVGPGGGILLLTLAEAEPMRIQDLVRRMARDKSQITRAVSTMERKGLIQRRSDPDDGRGRVLALTPEGRQTVRVLQGAVAGVLGEILAPLSDLEQGALREMLRRIE